MKTEERIEPDSPIVAVTECRGVIYVATQQRMYKLIFGKLEPVLFNVIVEGDLP